MGFEEELFHELATNTWDKRSRMQQEMVKGAKGEPFAVQELYRKGPLTPSQLASSMKTTTGRVSTLLSALEKKGQITRESDPDDRRVVHVNLTEAGRERAERQRESMREAGSAARANSLSSPRNSPRTCRCACPANRAPRRTRSKPRSQETHRKTRSILRCK